MEPKCCKCGRVIPRLRLDALGETPYCVKCSPTLAKTVLDIEVDSSDPADLQRMVMTPGGEK